MSTFPRKSISEEEIQTFAFLKTWYENLKYKIFYIQEFWDFQNNELDPQHRYKNEDGDPKTIKKFITTIVITEFNCILNDIFKMLLLSCKSVPCSHTCVTKKIIMENWNSTLAIRLFLQEKYSSKKNILRIRINYDNLK